MTTPRTTILAVMLALALAACGEAQQSQATMSDILSPENWDVRYNGDTAWTTGRGKFAGFSIRDVFRHGSSADTAYHVTWRNGAAEKSQVFVYRGDSIWEVVGKEPRLLSGFRLVTPKGIRTVWRSNQLLQRLPPVPPRKKP